MIKNYWMYKNFHDQLWIINFLLFRTECDSNKSSSRVQQYCHRPNNQKFAWEEQFPLGDIFYFVNASVQEIFVHLVWEIFEFSVNMMIRTWFTSRTNDLFNLHRIYYNFEAKIKIPISSK